MRVRVTVGLDFRQDVPEYWIVDPDEGVVDVWRLGREPYHERFTETLSVRLGTERFGEIDLQAVFAPDFRRARR